MSENLVGKTLKEHYYLEKKLDNGGFGTIYLAKDTFSAIGGYYVVKHFSPQYENEAQLSTAMRLFQQESESLQKLGNHPQIPRIYDFFEQESQFFLVQEYIEGQNMQQELAASIYLDRDRTIKLLTDTLEVLKFVHQSGYIHRDIKPSNLIINRFNQRIFLIDFGAVKEKIDPKNIGDSGEFSLTVSIFCQGYTPEEQFHGRPQDCSDLYALGMVIIQAMTGQHPRTLYRNDNLKLMWRDRLPSNHDYDSSFLDIIDRMVEQKWQQRYRSASAILEDIANLNLGQNTDLPTPPDPEPIPLPNKTNKFKKLASGVILSAIAILVWLYIDNSRRAKLITYENEYIQLEYPATWKRETNSNSSNSSVVFVSPKENESDEFQEKVTVTLEESPQPLSLQQYSDRMVEQIENSSNFILSPPKSTKLGRSDGKYIIYLGTDRERKVKRKEVWTVNYKQIYTVVYTAEVDKFDKFLPQAEKMIESLEIIR